MEYNSTARHTMEHLRSSSPALLDALSHMSSHRWLPQQAMPQGSEPHAGVKGRRERATCSPPPNLHFHRPCRSNEWGQLMVQEAKPRPPYASSRQHQSMSPTTLTKAGPYSTRTFASIQDASQCAVPALPGLASGLLEQQAVGNATTTSYGRRPTGSHTLPRQRVGKSSAATTSCCSPTRLRRSTSHNSHDSPPLGAQASLRDDKFWSPRSSVLTRQPFDAAVAPLSPQPEHVELLASEDGSDDHSVEDGGLRRSTEDLRCVDDPTSKGKSSIRPRRSLGHFGWGRDWILPPMSSRSDSDVSGARKHEIGRTRLKSSSSIKRFAGMARRVSDVLLSIVQPGASSASQSHHGTSDAEIRSDSFLHQSPRRVRRQRAQQHYSRPPTPEAAPTPVEETLKADDSALWAPSVGGHPRLDHIQKERQSRRKTPRRLNTAPAVLDIDPFRPAPQRFVWKGNSPADSQESHLFSPQYTTTASGPSLQMSNESPPTTLCTLTDDVQSSNDSHGKSRCEPSKPAVIDEELSTVSTTCDRIPQRRKSRVQPDTPGEPHKIRKRPSTTIAVTDGAVIMASRSQTSLRARRRGNMLPPASPAPQVPPPPPPRFVMDRQKALSELVSLSRRPETVCTTAMPLQKEPEQYSGPRHEETGRKKKGSTQPVAVSTCSPIAVNQRVPLEKLRSMQPIKMRLGRHEQPSLLTPGSCM